MFPYAELCAVVLAGIAMAPAVAHAFEFPGKRRLDRDAYLSAQTIYYPGFTILGIAEPLGLIAVIALLLLTPRGTASFSLRFVALIALLAMQAVYWGLIHPTNKYWLRAAGAPLSQLVSGFFSFDPAGRREVSEDWIRLRNRWEYSHIARAALGFLSFLLLLLAIVV